MIEFSLLMCIYAKESPLFLTQCLDSILLQTVMPDEMIIVKDGPLPDELETVLKDFRFSGGLNVIGLPENVTLGPARAIGVEAAKHEWIAIMDSDDICRPDRFEKQLDMIEKGPKLGLTGGQISEFDEDPGSAASSRIVPTEHDCILRFMKKRNPFNSMTVMLRRELALSSGNYRFFPWFEDYDLWTRMIINGAHCANHPEVLVDARVGSGMYRRRRGTSYIRSEWRMQRQLKELKLINNVEFLRNAASRIPVRLLPEKALETAYNKFARK